MLIFVLNVTYMPLAYFTNLIGKTAKKSHLTVQKDVSVRLREDSFKSELEYVVF